MRSRGVTFLELLVATAISVIVLAGGSRAFLATVDAQRRLAEEDVRWMTRIRFEDQIRSLLRTAALLEGEGRTDSYFIAYASSNSSDGTASDTVVFTSIGARPKYSAVTDTDEFEDRNDIHGPVGGVREVSISLTPYNAPNGLEGVFLREQVPADGDYDQGGFESLISDEVDLLRFEFFDGTDWYDTWDTTAVEGTDASSSLTPGLPYAIRVTYGLANEPDVARAFVVLLPHADAAASFLESSEEGTAPAPGGGQQQ